MTSARVGSARSKGRFDRPEGAFRLALGLQEPGDLPLHEAVELVAADWLRQLYEDKVAPLTYEKSERGVRRFAAYAKGQGVQRLTDVTTEVAQAYCDARNAAAAGGIARAVAGQPAAGGTRNSRRTHLRAFFNTCIALGLIDRDPTAGVVVPYRQRQRFVRPLTDAELAVCKHRSRKQVGETRLPAAVALASRGTTTAELSAIRVCDVHLDAAKVWLHGGGTRTQARWADLDDWSLDALRRRVGDLAATVAAGALADHPVVYVAAKGDAATKRPTSRQSSAAVTLGRVLELAGLAEVPGVRPSSFTEHAAGRIWKETGRLEAVAAQLGMRGLDLAADLLRHDWRVKGPDGVCDPDTPATYAGTVLPPSMQDKP